MAPAGRPRNTDTEIRIVQAMSELVIERGYSHVTVEQVVERAGTNKPAFYRRFSRLADVVPHALSALQHEVDDIDMGSLVDDLIEFQCRQRRLFTAPLVTQGLVGWLPEVGEKPERARPFVEQFQTRRRNALRLIVERAIARGESPAGSDVDWVTDVLTAPLIMRAIIPGQPPINDRLIEQTVHAALDALRYRGDRSAVDDMTPSQRAPQ